MKGFERKNRYFSLCGLNCALCPMYVGGYCPSCGGGAGNQSCRIAKCSIEQGSIEFCFECKNIPASIMVKKMWLIHLSPIETGERMLKGQKRTSDLISGNRKKRRKFCFGSYRNVMTVEEKHCFARRSICYHCINLKK